MGKRKLEGLAERKTAERRELAERLSWRKRKEDWSPFVTSRFCYTKTSFFPPSLGLRPPPSSEHHLRIDKWQAIDDNERCFDPKSAQALVAIKVPVKMNTTRSLPTVASLPRYIQAWLPLDYGPSEEEHLILSSLVEILNGQSERWKILDLPDSLDLFLRDEMSS